MSVEEKKTAAEILKESTPLSESDSVSDGKDVQALTSKKNTVASTTEPSVST